MQRIVNVSIPTKYFMSWFVTTQTSNRVTVTLKDDKKTYFSNSRQSTNIDPPLAMGYGFVAGNNLQLVIDIPGAANIKGTPHLNDVVTDNGTPVGKEFNLCIEDYNDDDYNDVSVNIVGWKGVG